MTNEHEKRLTFMFDEAMKLRDERKLIDARAILRSLVVQLDSEDKVLLPHSHMQLGYIADLLGDHAQREPHFRAAVAVAPNNELASLGLFHALLHFGAIPRSASRNGALVASAVLCDVR